MVNRRLRALMRVRVCVPYFRHAYEYHLPVAAEVDTLIATYHLTAPIRPIKAPQKFAMSK